MLFSHTVFAVIATELSEERDGNKLADGPVGMSDNLSDIGSTMKLTEGLRREQT